MYCPITKMYDEVKVKLKVKIKVGDNWEVVKGEYDVSKMFFYLVDHQVFFYNYVACKIVESLVYSYYGYNCYITSSNISWVLQFVL